MFASPSVSPRHIITQTTSGRLGHTSCHGTSDARLPQHEFVGIAVNLSVESASVTRRKSRLSALGLSSPNALLRFSKHSSSDRWSCFLIQLRTTAKLDACASIASAAVIGFMAAVIQSYFMQILPSSPWLCFYQRFSDNSIPRHSTHSCLHLKCLIASQLHQRQPLHQLFLFY